MEIDFLGLSSPMNKLDQEKNRKNPFVDAAGGIEISLSLSTTSSLNLSEKKKWEFAACDKMISPSCSGSTVCSLAPYNQQDNSEQPSVLVVAPPAFRRSAAGFLYDLNDTATTNDLRNMSRLSAENRVYISGNIASTTTTVGHTPTVAMARRATLARFLEKRLHRMSQARASHLKGNSPSATKSAACETTITRNNKKRSNNLRTR